MINSNDNKRSYLPFGSSYTEKSRLKRLDFLKSYGHSIDSYLRNNLNSEEVKSNIESYIGSMSIPVGIVGPLSFNNNNDLEDVYCPAATTEGALVASMNRGASVISQCGGFSGFVNKQVMTRAPIFCFENISESIRFKNWLEEKKEFIAVYIKNYSKHAELNEIKIAVLGRDVEAKFYFETADASGQNMTTICTWKSCQWIIREFERDSNIKITDFVLEGNGASDKKVSYDSIINGRGVDVIVDCVIDEEVLQKKLKVSSEEILKWHAKSRPIIVKNGMVGDNVNVANSIAAIFTATGQDIACIQESSIGFLKFEPHERGLYITLHLPKLVVGTVGGGTSLPSQYENLKLMGCEGAGKIERFAMLIAGFSMALELSTISAMVSGQFAIAHEKLGRNKPVKVLKETDDINLFLQKNFIKESSIFLEMVDDLKASNGIVTQVSSENSEKFIGLSLWSLNSKENQYLSLLKSKPTDIETLNCMYILTGMIDPALARIFKKYQDHLDFKNCHKKELEVCKILEVRDIKYTPKILSVYEDDAREIYLILMEFLKSQDYKIMNSEMNSYAWNIKDVKTLMVEHYKGLSTLQSLNQNELFKKEDINLSEYYDNLNRVLILEYPEEDELLIIFKNSIGEINNSYDNKYFKTFIHNDFNPRNIAISNSGMPKVYDWELSTVGLPQRDFIELIIFIFDNPQIEKNFEELLEFSRQEFNRQFFLEINKNEWRAGVKMAFSEFIVQRLSLYMLGNKLKEYSFVEKIIENIIKISKVI